MGTGIWNGGLCTGLTGRQPIHWEIHNWILVLRQLWPGLRRRGTLWGQLLSSVCSLAASWVLKRGWQLSGKTFRANTKLLSRGGKADLKGFSGRYGSQICTVILIPALFRDISLNRMQIYFCPLLGGNCYLSENSAGYRDLATKVTAGPSGYSVQVLQGHLAPWKNTVGK